MVKSKTTAVKVQAGVKHIRVPYGRQKGIFCCSVLLSLPDQTGERFLWKWIQAIHKSAFRVWVSISVLKEFLV